MSDSELQDNANTEAIKRMREATESQSIPDGDWERLQPLAWWDVLKIPRESTKYEIDAAYLKAWSSVGVGNPELESNAVKMTPGTFLKLMAEVEMICAAYKAAMEDWKWLNSVKGQ